MAGYRIFSTTTGDKRLVRKALALPSFISFVARTAAIERPDVIVASFWDSALAGAWATIRYRTPLVYDVLDMPGGGRVMYAIGRTVERMALSRVNATVLASRFFEPFYRASGRSNVVLENHPDLGAPPVVMARTSYPPRIAYVGSVRFPETLLPLIDESLAQGARLDLYGGGPDLHRLQRHSHGRGEILFHGAYSYNDLPRIYREIDLLWAAYPANDVNVRYAISNKYFESLWFGVPAVFAQGTMLGAMIAREGTGFEVNATDRRAVGALLHRIRSEATLYGETRERLLEKRERIVGDLSWDSQQYRFVELLEEVCRC